MNGNMGSAHARVNLVDVESAALVMYTRQRQQLKGLENLVFSMVC